MNKKIVGGLLALMFVCQIAQTSAILNLYAKAKSPATNEPPVGVANLSQNLEGVRGSQVAVPVYWMHTFTPMDNGNCLYSVFGFNSDGNIESQTHEQISGGCPGSASAPVGDSIGTVAVTVRDGQTVVTGSSPDIEAQYKLIMLGYLDQKYLSNKLGTVAQGALKAFQKEMGISQTGTYGPQTKSALDKAVAGLVPNTGFDFGHLGSDLASIPEGVNPADILAIKTSLQNINRSLEVGGTTLEETNWFHKVVCFFSGGVWSESEGGCFFPPDRSN